MRIGIDIRKVGAAGSGQQRYLWRLANWLRERGEDVHVLSLKSPPNGSWDEGSVDSAGERPVQVHSLVGLSASAIRERVTALELDVFFANPERADAYAGLPMHVLRPGYGTRQGIQNLRSIRNHWLRAGYRATRNLPWERRSLRRERDWYRQTQPRPQVIAISELMRRAIIADYGVSEDRIHLVHNGVDLHEFAPVRMAANREAQRRRFGIPEEVFCPLFVGHNFRRKGLPETLGAMATIDPKAHLLVAGRGTGRIQRRRTRAMVERLGLTTRVHFAGNVVPVTDAYAAADALVFPSWHDAFGFVVLEAMAAGLPVVTTRLAGAHEVVREGRDGFVLDTPAEQGKLGDALGLLADPVRRLEMGAAATERASGFSEVENFEAVHAVMRLAHRL